MTDLGDQIRVIRKGLSELGDIVKNTSAHIQNAGSSFSGGVQDINDATKNFGKYIKSLNSEISQSLKVFSSLSGEQSSIQNQLLDTIEKIKSLNGSFDEIRKALNDFNLDPAAAQAQISKHLEKIFDVSLDTTELQNQLSGISLKDLVSGKIDLNDLSDELKGNLKNLQEALNIDIVKNAFEKIYNNLTEISQEDLSELNKILADIILQIKNIKFEDIDNEEIKGIFSNLSKELESLMEEIKNIDDVINIFSSSLDSIDFSNLKNFSILDSLGSLEKIPEILSETIDNLNKQVVKSLPDISEGIKLQISGLINKMEDLVANIEDDDLKEFFKNQLNSIGHLKDEVQKSEALFKQTTLLLEDLLTAVTKIDISSEAPIINVDLSNIESTISQILKEIASLGDLKKINLNLIDVFKQINENINRKVGDVAENVNSLGMELTQKINSTDLSPLMPTSPFDEMDEIDDQISNIFSKFTKKFSDIFSTNTKILNKIFKDISATTSPTEKFPDFYRAFIAKLKELKQNELADKLEILNKEFENFRISEDINEKTFEKKLGTAFKRALSGERKTYQSHLDGIKEELLKLDDTVDISGYLEKMEDEIEKGNTTKFSKDQLILLKTIAKNIESQGDIAYPSRILNEFKNLRVGGSESILNSLEELSYSIESFIKRPSSYAEKRIFQELNSLPDELKDAFIGSIKESYPRIDIDKYDISKDSELENEFEQVNDLLLKISEKFNDINIDETDIEDPIQELMHKLTTSPIFELDEVKRLIRDASIKEIEETFGEAKESLDEIGSLSIIQKKIEDQLFRELSKSLESIKESTEDTAQKFNIDNLQRLIDKGELSVSEEQQKLQDALAQMNNVLMTSIGKPDDKIRQETSDLFSLVSDLISRPLVGDELTKTLGNEFKILMELFKDPNSDLSDIRMVFTKINDELGSTVNQLEDITSDATSSPEFNESTNNIGNIVEAQNKMTENAGAEAEKLESVNSEGFSNLRDEIKGQQESSQDATKLLDDFLAKEGEGAKEAEKREAQNATGYDINEASDATSNALDDLGNAVDEAIRDSAQQMMGGSSLNDAKESLEVLRQSQKDDEQIALLGQLVGNSEELNNFVKALIAMLKNKEKHIVTETKRMDNE